jgi:hypothetical protein
MTRGQLGSQNGGINCWIPRQLLRQFKGTFPRHISSPCRNYKQRS